MRGQRVKRSGSAGAGVGFEVQGSGLRGEDMRLRIKGVEFRVEGSGFKL